MAPPAYLPEIREISRIRLHSGEGNYFSVIIHKAEQFVRRGPSAGGLKDPEFVASAPRIVEPGEKICLLTGKVC